MTDLSPAQARQQENGMKRVACLFAISLFVAAASSVMLGSAAPQDQNEKPLPAPQSGGLSKLLDVELSRDEARKQMLALHPEFLRCYQHGRWHEALPLARKAAELAKKLNEDDPMYTASLNNLGAVYLQLGHYRDALPLLRRALQVRRKLGEDHPLYAQSLNALAALHQAMGNHEEALPLFQSAFSITAKLGDRHPDHARSMHQLAVCYYHLAQHKKALPLAQKALKLHEQLGENHPGYVPSLNSLASVYMALGEYEQALPLYRTAVKISRRLGEDHPDHVTSLHDLAVIYQAMGQYEEALPLQEKAVQISEKLGDRHPDHAVSLQSLALLYQGLGRYHDALPLHRKALQITRALGEYHPAHGMCLDNLAALYYQSAEYHLALPLQRRALEIAAKLGRDHPDYARSLHSLASLYRALGQYDQALPLHQEALRIARLPGQHQGNLALCLIGLAGLYQDRNQHNKALPLYREAFRITERLGTDHPLHALCLNDLADCYRSLGQHDQALPLYQDAVRIYRKLGEDHLYYAAGLNNLAVLYWSNGQYEQARKLLREALQITEQLGRRNLYYAARVHNMASLYWAMGQPHLAVQWFDKGLAIHQDLFDKTASVLTPQQRLQLMEHKKREYLDVYLAAAQEAALPPSAMYRQVLVWKGAVCARQSEEVAVLDQPQLQPLMDRLRAKRANLAKLLQISPPTLQERRAWQQRFHKTEDELEKLEQELAQQSEPYRRFRDLGKATPKDVIDALPARSALIDFLFYTHRTPAQQRQGKVHGDRRLLAFVLRPKRDPVLVPLGKAALIAKLVLDWREAVATELDSAAIDAIGRQLRAYLWRPLSEHLQGTTTVLIAPDEELCQLPFAALPGSRNGTYQVEEFAFDQVISGRQLLELQADRKRPRSRGLLAIGGLNYDTPAGLAALARPRLPFHWTALPGSRLEAEQVQQQFQKLFAEEPNQLLTAGKLDGPDFVRRFAPGHIQQRWRFLHLATHAYFEPPQTLHAVPRLSSLSSPHPERETMVFGKHPLLRSSLAFAGANADPTTGMLTAQEIAGLDFRGLDLAVLSACDTGLGKLQSGEGVQGLQQAFHQAGCRSLVASLWSIDDAATALLMEEFYRNLWQRKMSKVEALRQAQLHLLHHPELISKMQKKVNQQLARRGMWTTQDRQALAAVTVIALPLIRGPESPLTAAAALTAPTSRRAFRGPGAVAQPVLGGGAPGARRSHPAYWAAFVLSGDPR
jgi:CHAT domain-containing protein/Tfp pilus assembly protein PilF